MHDLPEDSFMNSSAFKSCIVVTCFAENQPGYLDFSYRINALAKQYRLTVLSQDVLDQTELLVPAATYLAMGRQNGKYGWLNYLRRCAAYARRHRPDVLVLLHSSAAPISLLVPGVPVVLYWNEHPGNLMHLPAGFSPLRKLLALASQRLVFVGARHADLVMPIGEAHYDDLLDKDCRKERLKLTYMGVADVFSGCALARVKDDACLELIYIGTVSAARGRDVMLEGMALALRNCQGHEVRLTIVGADDEQQAYCKQKISEYGIEEQVRILGRVPGSEIPALLAKADLGICLWEDKPWWRFNPPTKLFEYLTAGLPVLASNIRTHTHYLQDWHNGLIFEYGAAGFAQGIGQLLAGRSRLAQMQRNAMQDGQSYLWSKLEPVFLGHVAGLVNT
jgi:glycosyltransferase involved in cell wall biosynthesis